MTMNPNMTPIDWAKRPVVDKYADFNGRASRAEYWWYILAIIVVTIVISIVDSILGLNRMVLGIYGPLTTLLLLVVIVPSLAVAVRRLHDTNRSGWWLLIGLIPLIGAIVLLVFFVSAGTAGSNDYGPDPYGRDSETAYA
jgi:uncharacterized membrane protein YhaH (DUF805 family)